MEAKTISHRGFEIIYDKGGYIIRQGDVVIHASRDIGYVDPETNRQRAILWVEDNSVDKTITGLKP